MVDDAQAASLAAARNALERGEYGKVLTLLEPIAAAHGPRTPLGAGVRLLIATALMGQGESERAAECCRAVQNCLDPGLRARARELLTVLEAPALNRPRSWSLTLPDLASDTPLERLGPGAGGRRRPTPPPPPPPPVGPTRAPVGFAALAGLLLLLLLAALLGGCVQVRSDLRFVGPGRLQLSHQVRSATGPISPWQRSLEGELASRGFMQEPGEGGRRLRTPVLPAPQALDAWVESVSAAGELAGLALPPPRAELRERNWLLGVEQRLRLEVDLADLEPMAGLRLELGLAPLRQRAVRIASPLPAVAEGDGLRWPLAPGGANQLEVRCWRWSPLGIGGLAIALVLGLALLLQRMRLALGYGLPQLPAGITTAGDPGRS